MSGRQIKNFAYTGFRSDLFEVGINFIHAGCNKSKPDIKRIFPSIVVGHARITVYEISAAAVVGEDGFVIADFPSARPGRIRRGQAAWLYPVPGGAKQPGSVPAVVIAIIRSPSAEPTRVKLFPVLDRDLSEMLPADQKVRAEIEVESVSPSSSVTVSVTE